MSYRVPSRVLRARMDDDEVMLNPDTGMYHLLEEGGAQIVAAIEAGDDVATVIASIAEDTGADIERIRADVGGFIADLVARGLLEEVRSS